MTCTTQQHSRTMVIVDVENVAGAATLTSTAVAMLREELTNSGAVAPGDHVVIACAPHNALPVALGWPRARYLWRGGHDGADLALLEVIATEDLPGRFGKVTVCSGDGLFTHGVRYLASSGCRVTVIARQRHCSYLLWRYASHVTLLPDRTPAHPEHPHQAPLPAA